MLRVLMPSWTLPPKICGGMDIYTWELASRLKCKIIIPVPYFNIPKSIRVPSSIEIIPIKTGKPTDNLYSDIKKFSDLIFETCKDFDIIHSNDWLFALLSLRYKTELDKKFVLTVHSLEYMRAVNPFEKNEKIEKIEKEIFKEADAIITVSDFMRKQLSSIRKEIL